jgi:hypothetical protein
LLSSLFSSLSSVSPVWSLPSRCGREPQFSSFVEEFTSQPPSFSPVEYLPHCLCLSFCLFPRVLSLQRESWLLFSHRAFFHQERDRPNQDRDRSTLRKMIEIPDLFRFITEFMLEEEEDEESEEEEDRESEEEEEESDESEEEETEESDDDEE